MSITSCQNYFIQIIARIIFRGNHTGKIYSAKSPSIEFAQRFPPPGFSTSIRCIIQTNNSAVTGAGKVYVARTKRGNSSIIKPKISHSAKSPLPYDYSENIICRTQEIMSTSNYIDTDLLAAHIPTEYMMPITGKIRPLNLRRFGFSHQSVAGKRPEIRITDLAQTKLCALGDMHIA